MMTASIDISAFRVRDHVRAGDVISWPQGPGEPTGLTRALMEQRHDLGRASLLLPMLVSDTVTPEHGDVFAMRGINASGAGRRLTAAGVLDIVPVHGSAMPGLLASGRLHVDVALVQVRPHPASGRYTLGVMCDYTQALIASARTVIAQLNPHLPLTGQDALVDAADLDVLVSAPDDVLDVPEPTPQAQEEAVARHVAELVPDRATLQLGIGTMPVAVARALARHRDLGVHSGVISDVIVDLVEGGAVTNAFKGVDRGCIVTGGLFGTHRLYEFANANPNVHLRAIYYTHDLAVLAKLGRFHSINSAVEVDLTGQVNAEVAAGRYLGAVGGQVDFVRGAAAAPDGRSIIALPSTTGGGKHTRIVTRLEAAPVTTARSDVDVVVTEHGIADLRGRSLEERARLLMAIADPAFREALEREWVRGNAPRRI